MLKFLLKEFLFIVHKVIENLVSMAAMLHQLFNDIVLSAMLLHQWHHRSVTIATTELSDVLQSSLAECPPDDIILISMWRNICYDL